jgi:hypothetical protein
MAIGMFSGRPWMGTVFRDCSCSILNAREEKLLDDEGRVQIRLICNRCGTVLDSEIVHAAPRSKEARQPATAVEREAEAG